MTVTVPKNSGFCPGNRFAELSLKQLKKDRPDKSISIIDHLLHNIQYTDQVVKKDFRILPFGECAAGDCIAVIGTHGIEKKAGEDLRVEQDVIELTCSKIKHLQNYVSYYAENGYYTVITGEAGHPEVKGLVSYAHDHTVIGSEEDLNNFLDDFRNSKGDIVKKSYCKVLVLTQTTGSRVLFGITAKAIQEQFNRTCEVKILDSSCSYNVLREEDALRLRREADLIIVLGEKTESNARLLYEALGAYETETCLVSNLSELRKSGINLSGRRNILAVASSSTPRFVENEVLEYLRGLRNRL